MKREDAKQAAATLRAVLAAPTLWGEPVTGHFYLPRPRRGVWLATWATVPGLSRWVSSREGTSWHHVLLPKWEYTTAEMKTEMLDDLDHLAATGELPKEATR